MRVENFQSWHSGDLARVTFRLVWEDSDEPPFDAYLEAFGEAGADLGVSPDALAVFALPPALRFGERRLALPGRLDSRLAENLSAVQALFRSWRGYRPLRIDIEVSTTTRQTAARAKTAAFLSGGVDACHLLWANRRDFGRTHPRSIGECIHVAGLSYEGDLESPAAASLHRRSLRAVSAITAAAGASLTIVRTNLKSLAQRYTGYGLDYESAFFAAICHSLARRIGRAQLAATYGIQELHPYGTHPLLTPLYSSAAVDIELAGAHRNRQQKLEELSRWPAALENLQVCFEGPTPGEILNCGSCEKCLRTMVGLMLAGRLTDVPAFPRRDVTAADIAACNLGYGQATFRNFWPQFVEPLARAGRTDLSRAVSEKLDKIKHAERWRNDAGLKGRLRRADRALLGGRLTAWSRRLRGLERKAAP